MNVQRRKYEKLLVADKEKKALLVADIEKFKSKYEELEQKIPPILNEIKKIEEARSKALKKYTYLYDVE